MNQNNNSDKQFSKAERKEIKKQQKIQEQLGHRHSRRVKKIYQTTIIILVAASIIGGVVWLAAKQPPLSETDIISRKGLHWHATLKIYINEELREIPANIGLGAVHLPLHTHEQDGIIHMEFSGLVQKDDLKLGRFFEIWNKKFNSDCIFDFCAGANETLKMLVNKQTNTDFGNYIMQDEDEIEIIFENKKPADSSADVDAENN